MAKFKEVDFGFKPYPPQQELIHQLRSGCKNIYCVWPRRGGKDRACIDVVLTEAMLRVGTYLYGFITVPQAKLALWNSIDMEGKTLRDYIPEELVYKINETEMSITLRHPNDLSKPGSIIKVTGTDKGGKTLRGGNYMGVVLSEFAYMDPEVVTVVMPSLARTNGWLILNTTVNGHNHAYDMWNATLQSDDWFNSFYTCETYLDNNGQRVISADYIDKQLKAGAISQARVNQEFYNDFDAAVEGAVFTHEIEKSIQEGRIKDFAIADVPVSMFMDIGINAKTGCTSIFFVQFLPDESIRFVDYMEDSDQPAVYYVNKIKQWMKDNGCTWGKCYLPHDSMHRDKIERNTYAKRYVELGMEVEVIPRIEKKSYAIEFTRQKFRNYYIHKTKCARGIQALREYNWDTMGKTHWANHACDAFLAVGQYLNLEKRKPKFSPIMRQSPLARGSAF